MRAAIVSEIQALLEGKAEGRYGLTLINQQQHALQAAWLAEQEGHGDALVTASLLHDIGHLVHDLGANPADAGIDDRHEEVGHAWLVNHFGPAVTEPVRLHVAAKRYLCAVEPDYFARLSPDSVKSLALQGGPMSAEEAKAFEALSHSAEAVQLRRYDERAKVKGLETPAVAHFMPAVARSLK
ncbi:phosphonate degradation HD-domain oxygenase [Roseomonas sp. CECT 9278]|uniref:phosphonate degradation HD-domain oxygenase n=1 Tax=Roseomonas sp. CECT 9278 TaxID=2845823 RepID=UPI001E3B8C37|nr:phosphonate degradation HD-domain oxygenase [Roseomonas sp. CECT 9278]CAH0200970.1 2-amino-1-hydroxyethylphosphonate dioxygenase (glycine-forming) [Roseomonas sp. CECT 9278]